MSNNFDASDDQAYYRQGVKQNNNVYQNLVDLQRNVCPKGGCRLTAQNEPYGVQATGVPSIIEGECDTSKPSVGCTKVPPSSGENETNVSLPTNFLDVLGPMDLARNRPVNPRPLNNTEEVVQFAAPSQVGLGGGGNAFGWQAPVDSRNMEYGPGNRGR